MIHNRQYFLMHLLGRLPKYKDLAATKFNVISTGSKMGSSAWVAVSSRGQNRPGQVDMKHFLSISFYF